jgi:hypothetical protein
VTPTEARYVAALALLDQVNAEIAELRATLAALTVVEALLCLAAEVDDPEHGHDH